MVFTLSIYSKNLSSLTNFLKLFYKLNINKFLRFKLSVLQSPQPKKKIFFSVLRSPHVNKSSQEQFEYCLHSTKLKISVSQITKFLSIWKIFNTELFADLKIKTKFVFNKKPAQSFILFNITSEKFQTIFYKKRLKYFNENTKNLSQLFSHTALFLLDIQGEIMLKNYFQSLDSSAGRAKDWKSLWRQFKPVSKQIKIFYDKSFMKFIH